MRGQNLNDAKLVFVMKRAGAKRAVAGEGHGDGGVLAVERWSYERDGHELLGYHWQGPTGSDASDAPRFLLVHGIGMGHRSFTRFIEAMHPYAEIIAVDLPGFGDSPEPETALSIAGTAELLAEALVIQELGPKGNHGCGSEGVYSREPVGPGESGESGDAGERAQVFGDNAGAEGSEGIESGNGGARSGAGAGARRRPLIAVGHSMGAQLVVELAASHPELVERVVLFAPAVNAAERTLPQQARRMRQDLLRGKPLVALVTGIVDYCRAGPRWMLMKLEPMLDYRIEDRLPEVQQPALVLVGSKDLVTPPEWCYQVALELPDGELTVLGGPGHEAMIAEGEAAAERVLYWLEA